MFIELTQVVSGDKILVNLDAVQEIVPHAGRAKIIYKDNVDGSWERQVQESYEDVRLRIWEASKASL